MSDDRRRFDVYGRFRIEVVREDSRWVVYRYGAGTRRVDDSLSLPGNVNDENLAVVLEDLLHEYARPGHILRRVQ